MDNWCLGTNEILASKHDIAKGQTRVLWDHHLDPKVDCGVSSVDIMSLMNQVSNSVANITNIIQRNNTDCFIEWNNMRWAEASRAVLWSLSGYKELKRN